MESANRKEPRIALAGRFVRDVGCGCEVCTERHGDDGAGVLGLRKCDLTDVQREALARLTRANWEEEGGPEQWVERHFAAWFCSLCCAVVTRCAAGV